MKLEVGMYVRTKRGINKINEYVPQSGQLYLKTDVCVKSNVLKASHNIIDLIEVGDVIVDEVGNKYPINYEFETDYNDEYQSYEITIDDRITLFLKDGLSIVTKEQFEAIAYKVV